MNTRSFWMWFVGVSLLGIPCLFLALVSAGAGHGSYLWANLFFPYMIILWDFTENLPALAATAIAQFVIYGFIIGLGSSHGKLTRAIISVLVIHFAPLGMMLGLSLHVPASDKLLDAVWKDDVTTVTNLQDRGVDPNTKVPGGGAPVLDIACQEGHLEIAKLLIQKGADVNYRDPLIGQTALMGAVTFQREQIVQLLLSRGADPKTKNTYGLTAMFWAKKDGNARIISMLEAAERGEKIEEPK